MQIRASIRRGTSTARIACSLLIFFGLVSSSFSQEPPLDVPKVGRLPARDPNAIDIDGWQVHPALRLYSLYSDNLFFSSLRPLSVPGFGVTPSMTAQWSNGIHTSTFYGNLDRQTYPTENDINTLDGRAGFTQKYEAMRDLIFTANGEFNHVTWGTGLQNSLQPAAPAATAIVLPNGNTQLPNGNIISPTGQLVGQAAPTTTGSSTASTQVFVNPSNQYTGTFSVDKIFNRGILSLTEAVGRTEYESQTITQNTNRRTFTENAAFWLGPLFYAYSQGSIGTVVTEATSASTTSYRVLGGLGTRQFGLWRGSLYFGHQGSQGSSRISGGTSAGGDIYGGSISYYPTPRLTFTGSVDRTINISSQGSASNLALTLPSFAPIQLALSTSSRSTSASLTSSYEITQQWFADVMLGYFRVDYVGSTRVDNSWTTTATLRYDIWRNMSLQWDYRYRSIISNAPLATVNSNYFAMGTTYRF